MSATLITEESKKHVLNMHSKEINVALRLTNIYMRAAILRNLKKKTLKDEVIIITLIFSNTLWLVQIVKKKMIGNGFGAPAGFSP